MTFDDQLGAAFERGLEVGVHALSPADRDLFLVQDFIVEYESNGLTGYLYNRLPDTSRVREAVAAMYRLRLDALAAIVSEAVALFDGYSGAHPLTTWNEVVATRDPADRLGALSARIAALDGYGTPGDRTMS